MQAHEIRQSFLQFFQAKNHTVVPSASLLPQSPGLLFTNAGMNQFVAYFLGVASPPWAPARVADTQKCIRAGGKHNDLEDVGYDTYHHTLFEMLGNWSFGDYFKKEAIEWAWELVVEQWGFPPSRLYATVYSPNKAFGDPSEFDQESYDCWAALFRAKGLDPAVQIVNGGVKDNFWMMGETGPCGPCSELHVDLTPNGDSGGKLVNMDSDLCIEIWNLVFIQYNAESDGTFRNLPACHVDTGMGFERACSIIQCTKGFTDFSRKPSNYATDVFRPLFDKLEQLSSKTYHDIYPTPGNKAESLTNTALKEAIAFRVIADHIRTLSFSIADGILPGNTGRNYVLRRILRRAVRYGRSLGFHQPFLAELVDTLVGSFGSIFPELIARISNIKETLLQEETSFNETLDRGLALFAEEADRSRDASADAPTISGDFAFKLYDTFGFPIDLTSLLAEEQQLHIDMPRFEHLMTEQRERARSSRKSSIVRALDIQTHVVTHFCGYEQDTCTAQVMQVEKQGDTYYIITDSTPFYAEMGGQVSDTGTIVIGGDAHQVVAVMQIGQARAHVIVVDDSCQVAAGDSVQLAIDAEHRKDIEAHHTATHLLHKALHCVVSPDIAQQGSYVAADRLRFDFNSKPLTDDQIIDVEILVNQWITDALPVHGTEHPYVDVQCNTAIAQFFGDKYGDTVRVVQVGGDHAALDGVAMEFCGGTHIDNTKNIGLFKIKSEAAIASGVRRIEASCGKAALAMIVEHVDARTAEALTFWSKLQEANTTLANLGKNTIHSQPVEGTPIANILAARDIATLHSTLHAFELLCDQCKEQAITAEKQVRKAQAGMAAAQADALIKDIDKHSSHVIALESGSSELLQELLNGLKKIHFAHAAVLIIKDSANILLATFCGTHAQQSGLEAGKILQSITSTLGGKGGGRADQARGSVHASTDWETLQDFAKQAIQSN